MSRVPSLMATDRRLVAGKQRAAVRRHLCPRRARTDTNQSRIVGGRGRDTVPAGVRMVGEHRPVEKPARLVRRTDCCSVDRSPSATSRSRSNAFARCRRVSRGWIGSVRYTFESIGLDGGVRYARYDPDEQAAGGRLQEGSLMIGYRSMAVPVRGLVQYTYRGEEGAAAIQNDSVDAMAQVTF